MSQQPVMMDELRCGECNYLLNPYAQECPKCGAKVDPLDQMRWFVRSAASTIIVLVWSLVIYAGTPIPPWTIIPVAAIALFIVIRERSLFKQALMERRKRLDDLARMSGQFLAVDKDGVPKAVAKDAAKPAAKKAEAKEDAKAEEAKAEEAKVKADQADDSDEESAAN